MDIVEEIRGYLLEQADFNRSWVDGRRGGPGHLYQDKAYVERRVELAEQREKWAAELTRLRSLTAEMRAALQRIERGEIDGGGCRRECADAGAIARSALSRSQEGAGE